MADSDLDFSADFEALPLSEKETILLRIEEKVKRLDPGSEALKNLLYRLDVPEKIYTSPRALAEKIFQREIQKFHSRKKEMEGKFSSWSELFESAPKRFWKNVEFMATLPAEDFSKISLQAHTPESLAENWLSYLSEEIRERKRCPIRAFVRVFEPKEKALFKLEAEVQWTKSLNDHELELRPSKLHSFDSNDFSWTWDFHS